MGKRVLKGERNQVTVKVDVVITGDYGETENIPIELTFVKVHEVDRIMDLFAFRGDDEVSTEDSDSAKKEVLTIIKDYLTGWNVTCADGEPVPCSGEDIEEVMNHREYRDAIIGGFQQVQLGYNSYKAKN
ncbi:MAG: hypothetical protein KUF79_17375 [Candidatus Thiodiazotropha sp. (ex Ctena orbiculata)]|nr:hypothetical protein [Candidatus Thiodiazotropha taylori]